MFHFCFLIVYSAFLYIYGNIKFKNNGQSPQMIKFGPMSSSPFSPDVIWLDFLSIFGWSFWILPQKITHNYLNLLLGTGQGLFLGCTSARGPLPLHDKK